jgi:hypothetical protein
MSDYQLTPGECGAGSPIWPEKSPIHPRADRWTLVLFAHPQCPCTRASLSELARITARFPERMNSHVVFLKPEDSISEWEHTDLWNQAARIPGVQIWTDEAGRLADAFGAKCSGETLLYDTHCRLRFHGGITGSRGHEGSNAGQAAVISLVANRTVEVRDTSVFGCPLFSSKRGEDE